LAEDSRQFPIPIEERNKPVSYTNEFDDLFAETPPEPTLSTAQVRQVERIASEQLIRGYQALQQGQAVVQNLTAEAIRKTEASRPGFVERYRDPEICKKFIEQRPAVARAILNAESGQGTDSLPELYEIFDETARTYEQPSNRGSSTSTPASGSASILSLAQINSLPPERRREHIAALGDRIADIPLDDGDTENPRYKRERGE
jgi:hypothetical protein